MFCGIRAPAGFFRRATPWSNPPRTSSESSPAARPSCMAKEVLPRSFIRVAGSLRLSGRGMGTGPANMPEISPSGNPPSRSLSTEVRALLTACATGDANWIQESMLPSIQPERVRASAWPGAGSKAQTESNQRLASLMILATRSPSSAVTVVSDWSAAARPKAMDFARLTLMGPSWA